MSCLRINRHRPRRIARVNEEREVRMFVDARLVESLQWIRGELSPRVAVSLMAQYYPTNHAEETRRYVLLSRRINESEWLRAVAALDELGMHEGWVQEYDDAAFYYRPDFNDHDTPFRDIRDFG